MNVILSGLHLYPVKGCRGISVAEAEVDALGLVGDRRFLVVDGTGKFLTQRTHPMMARITTALDAAYVTLGYENAPALRVRRASDPAAPLRTVEVWSSQGLQAEDCGELAAEWLSPILGKPVRLVRAGAAYLRPIKPSKAQPGDVVSFADAYPFLIASEASLTDLNDRMAEQGEPPLPMNRFRPNLVVSGCPSFAEDTWPRFTINGITFRAAGTCVRCGVTTTDQETGARGKEPLRTLATYRRVPEEPSQVIFGQNVIHETKAGRLRVGDVVTVLPTPA